MASRKTIKSAIESMMFIWGEPLNIKDVADVFGIEKKEVYECCKELMEEYEQEGRGIVIREVNKAFQFTTREENLPYIERLCTPVRHRKLSQSALETLAIVAYRQPVTKGEIESIRDIRCDRVMEGLIRKGLVRDMGRSESVGRPILYGTTDEFLRQFGFETIKDLPDIKDIEGILDDETSEELRDSLDLQQISLEDLTSAAATGEVADTAEEGGLAEVDDSSEMPPADAELSPAEQ